MAFHALEKISQMDDGYQKAFSVTGLSLLLLQVDGKAYLIENRCPHMDIALTQAIQLTGQRIRCRAHGIEFDLESGKAAGPLSNQLDCLKKYPVAYEGNMIGVQINS